MGLPEIDYPTDKNGWAHCLTIPRELELKGDKLIQKPVKELELLRGEKIECSYTLSNEEKDIDGFNEKVYELICNFNNITGRYVGIKLRKGMDSETVFYYDIENKKLIDVGSFIRTNDNITAEKIINYAKNKTTEKYQAEKYRHFSYNLPHGLFGAYMPPVTMYIPYQGNCIHIPMPVGA